MFHDFRFGLGIVTSHLTYHCLKSFSHKELYYLVGKHYEMLTQLLNFSMWTRHLAHKHVKCVVTFPRQNLKS